MIPVTMFVKKIADAFFLIKKKDRVKKKIFKIEGKKNSHSCVPLS
jgi:hypothetical protein